MNLGESHFQVQIEAMPDERILWEGGPSRHGTTIRMIRIALFPAAFVFFYAWMFAVILSIPHAAGAGRGREKLVTPQSAVTATQSPAPTRGASSGSAPSEGLMLPLLMMSAILVPLFGAVGLTLANAYLQTRNGWYVVTNERICIQSGGFTRGVLVIDLDKVISVQASSTWLERRYAIQSVEVSHAGVQVQANPWRRREPNVISFVPVGDDLVSNLLNQWLPRDNAKQRI